MSQPAASVLLVDDDDTIREVITDILCDEGYRVRTAANGLEALQSMQSEGRPRLLLLDLMMPVMDGWALLEAMRQDPALARVPVVVMTAGGFQNRPSGDALAVAAYFEKPVRLDQLLEIVAHYCQATPPTETLAWGTLVIGSVASGVLAQIAAS